MRSAPYLFVLALGALLVAAATEIQATPEDEFQATQVELPRGELRIESHLVTVDITPGFATTTVDQVLVNPKAEDVSAQWAFPLPEEGALSELSVLTGEKHLEGEVVEKERAREILRQEADAGNTAALAEQDGFIDYRVEITKVPARGRVTVRLVYVQPVRVDAGVGRYVYPLREGNTRYEGPSPFWTMDRAVEQELRFDVTLRAAFPVDAMHCKSHPGFQAQSGEGDVWKGSVSLSGAPLEKDFVLYWRLAPDAPARLELLTHRAEGADEGTWLAVVTPGSDLGRIEGGTDWAFVLDVSGSMQGEKIRVLQRGVSRAMESLGPEDRVHIVAFQSTARDVTQGWLTMDAAGRARAQKAVLGLQPGGSTNVFAGLELAYARLDQDRPAGVILVSDGVANTGPHEYRDLIGLANRYDVRLFTFVMGNSANVTLLEDMATRTGGHAASISADDDVEGQLLLAQSRMTHEALHGIELELDGAVARHPAKLPSLYLGQQLVAVGRYDKTGPATLKVRAKVSGEPVTWTLPVELPAVDDTTPEIDRIYAFAAIEDLQREAWLATGNEDEARGAVLDLALRYSLVTDYTSMIVVEEDRKAVHGIGNDNAERRAREREAAAKRDRQGHRPQVVTGQRPLGGGRAEHAPTRYARNHGNSGNSGGGGGGGAGAVGPAYLLIAGGLGVLAWRRRKKRA
jgi:Ca-activated chloride channel family protein